MTGRLTFLVMASFLFGCTPKKQEMAPSVIKQEPASSAKDAQPQANAPAPAGVAPPASKEESSFEPSSSAPVSERTAIPPDPRNTLAAPVGSEDPALLNDPFAPPETFAPAANGSVIKGEEGVVPSKAKVAGDAPAPATDPVLKGGRTEIEPPL